MTAVELAWYRDIESEVWESIPKFMLVYPGIAWWREIYDLPFGLWQALLEMAEQRLQGR